MERSNSDSVDPGAGSRIFDEYGFVVPLRESDEEGGEHRSHMYSPPPSSDVVRERWKTVCEDWRRHEKDSPQKVRQLLRKGIPLELRSQVWQLFLNSGALKSQSTFNYKESLSRLYADLEAHGLTDKSSEENIRALNTLLDERIREGGGDQKEEEEETDGRIEGVEWKKNVRQVMLDIDRTFPHHRLFIGDTPTKRSLLHILMLYTEYNPTVGYCQGMGYVAALILMFMSEEDTFWALVSLFERPKYLSGYYDSSLGRIKTHAEVFTLLLRDRFPPVARHLENLGIHPLMYVTSWFMCLFTTLPCWDTVLAICDLLFLEGINTIFRAALAIFEVCAPELLALETIEKVLPFLQHIPSRLLARKSFTRVLWRTTVHSWEVELYQDMVFRRAELKSKLSSPASGMLGGHRGRKRAAPSDNEEPASQPSKKRKDYRGEEATPSTSQSLMSRIFSAITPGKPSVGTLNQTTPSVLPISPSTLNNLPAGRTPSAAVAPSSVGTASRSTRVTATARRQAESCSRQDLFKTPNVRGKTQKRRLDTARNTASNIPEPPCETFEMQEFSALRRSDTNSSLSSIGSDVADSAYVSMMSAPSCVVRCGQDSKFRGKESVILHGSKTPKLPPRRSPRLTKRRSLQQVGGFPSSSIVSPWTQRPLQDHVQSTRHPADHHAFRIFTTPTPLRVYQKRRRSSSSSHPPSPSTTPPKSPVSPEVELRPVKRRRRGRWACSPV